MLNRPIPRSSKQVILGLIVIVVIGTIPLMLMYPRSSNTQKQSRGDSEPVIIMPGLGVGDYTLGMSKDEVLKKLGEPETIHYAGEDFELNNLPRQYFMFFGVGISFEIDNDSVNSIAVNSPLYKFANGLGVGDSEEKIKQAFGDDFHLKEGGNDVLTYEDEGLTFEIHKKDRTVIEIIVTKKISRVYSEPVTIVPGLGVGDYTLGMSKDEVLKKLGEPTLISFAGERYTLKNLPKRYYMSFGSDICFVIRDDTVIRIEVCSPLYKFANGLGVGDSEEKIKQAFGNNFHLREFEKAEKDILTYEDEGLTFEIRKKDRTVMQISVRKKIEPVTIVPGPGVGDYTPGMSVIELPHRQVDKSRYEVVE